MAAAKKNRIGKIFIILLLTGIVILLIAGSYYGPAFMDKFIVKTMLTSLEESSISWRFTSKALTSGNIALGGNVTRQGKKEGYYNRIYIAEIDDESLEVFGRWPFNRAIHAQLLNQINKASEATGTKPPMLFFDIVFAESMKPKIDPNDPFFADLYKLLEKDMETSGSDQALFQAFSNYNGTLGEDVLLNYTADMLVGGAQENVNEQQKEIVKAKSYNYNSRIVQALKRFEVPESCIKMNPMESRNISQYNEYSAMLPELAESLDFFGPANIKFTGTVVRKKPMLFRVIYFTNRIDRPDDVDYVFRVYPDIILAMAIKTLQSDISNLVIEPGQITIRNATYEGKKMDFTIPVDDSFCLSINYKAPASAKYVKSYSYKDFFRMSSYSSNWIVLIGMYAQGAAHDIWPSPMGGDMFGVLHLAYALGTVLNRDFLVEVPEWINILYLVLFSVGISLLISRGIRTTIGAALISILVPLIVGFVFFQFNIIILMMPVLLSAILSLIAGVIYLLLTEEKEKKFIKSTFSSYVNPELVDILIQNPDMLRLGGDSKALTIMFSDIRSFTTLSEGMTPEYLINFLNDYLTRMTDIVMEKRGTLDKYIGDAVMAFWGAPIILEDHAVRACQAAVAMINSLREFNEARAKQGDKPIDIGIGLNTNVVNVGNVGSETRKNYTVIGDGVNLASRLEGANKYYGTHIIISEFTYEYVKDVVIARELDLMRVKGKNLPVKVYELVDMK